jgi:hypothetical protein
MQTGMVSLARWAVILSIVVSLPLLAIPSVTRKLGVLLYGQSADHLPVVSPVSRPEPVLSPQATSEHAPVSFDQPVDATMDSMRKRCRRLLLVGGLPLRNRRVPSR